MQHQIKRLMKPPITYYGGKQKMLKHILPLIPEHTLYAEPFCGGAAVFFAKAPSSVEVLNDINNELMNFYQVVQHSYDALHVLIQSSLHSRRLHEDAQVIHTNPHLFNKVQRAWAVWVLTTQSFGSSLTGSFGYDKKKDTTTVKTGYTKARFTELLTQRLEHVQLENTDAVNILTTRDSRNSFFYCDPPYYNSDCGHYHGYTKSNFVGLLKTLSTLQGKFLLSSFPSDILTEYVNTHQWNQQTIQQMSHLNNRKKHIKPKTEVLNANYSLSNLNVS